MITIYKWHSINLIPFGALVITRDDDGTESTLLEICWLGRVLHVDLPFIRLKKMHMLHPHGPSWSRRRKRWYFPAGDERSP